MNDDKTSSQLNVWNEIATSLYDDIDADNSAQKFLQTLNSQPLNDSGLHYIFNQWKHDETGHSILMKLCVSGNDHSATKQIGKTILVHQVECYMIILLLY